MGKKEDDTPPLVSIVIPVFNQEEIFLRTSIESAVGQSYRNIEIIISDNHSDDSNALIIAGYARSDTRIRMIRPDRFLPIIEHFIFAYSHARGKYICPLSSDDILYPNMIGEHLEPFTRYPEISFSYSVPLYFVKEIPESKWHPDKRVTGFYPAAFFLKTYIKRRHCTWGGILFKTEDYQRAGGFSQQYSFAGDVDMIIKLVQCAGGVYCMNKALSAIRQWVRDEHHSRTPYVLRDIAGIFDNLESDALSNNIPLRAGMAKKAKKIFFTQAVFPIAYYLRFKKRTPETIDETVTITRENYPKGVLNLVAKNRKNILCLFFSMGYLALMKLKRWGK